jgi:hypothetical protein
MISALNTIVIIGYLDIIAGKCWLAAAGVTALSKSNYILMLIEKSRIETLPVVNSPAKKVNKPFVLLPTS